MGFSRRSSIDGTNQDGHRAAKYPPSIASSKFSYEDSETKDYRIAVFDPLERKLWVDREENIKGII